MFYTGWDRAIVTEKMERVKVNTALPCSGGVGIPASLGLH